MEFLHDLFGDGKDLTPLQMSCRAFVVFFITMIIIRIAGKRTFGRKSLFDNIIVIMLGAILSRAVVGASPFVSTITACFVLAIIHRLLAWLSLTYPRLGSVVKGQQRSLYKNGQINRKNMNYNSLSDSDLEEGIRLAANTDSFDNIEEVYMESSGQISVVKKDPPKS